MCACICVTLWATFYVSITEFQITLLWDPMWGIMVSKVDLQTIVSKFDYLVNDDYIPSPSDMTNKYIKSDWVLYTNI